MHPSGTRFFWGSRWASKLALFTTVIGSSKVPRSATVGPASSADRYLAPTSRRRRPLHRSDIEKALTQYCETDIEKALTRCEMMSHAAHR